MKQMNPWRRPVLLLLAGGLLLSGALAQQVPPNPIPKAPSLTGIGNARGQSSDDLMELVRQKQWPQVAEVAEKLSQQNLNDPANYYWIGIARFQMHDSITAVRAFRAAEKLGMDTALLHEGLAFAYYDMNQFVLFEQQMNKAAGQDPQDFKPRYYLGLYYLTIQSDAASSLKYLDEAARLNPGDWKTAYQRGSALEQSGKPADARAAYEHAVEIMEKNREQFGEPYQAVARLLLEQDLQTALTYATKAVQAGPGEASNHLVLAKVQDRLGNRPEALREVRSAVTLSPEDTNARYLLFKLYRQSGDKAAAETELKKFQQLKAVYGSD
jgi:Flp pilus assembly protein TadD